MNDRLPASFGAETWKVRVTKNSVEEPRARIMADWLASGGALKHVLLRLEANSHGEIRASAQAFANLSICSAHMR